MLSFLTDFNFVLANLEVGQHFYWQIGGLRVHGQVFIVTWFVMAILIVASLLATRNVQRIPSGIQNLMEYVLDFVRQKASLAKKTIALGCPLLERCFYLSLSLTGRGLWCPGS